MSVLYINARCKQILHILLNSKHHMSMDQLAQEINVSRRSAYYDVSKINLWLNDHGIPPVETERGHGLYLERQYRDQVAQILMERPEEGVYIYSPKERNLLIVLQILYNPGPVFVETLMDCCQVSRNTIFGDLKFVCQNLEKYDLTLKFSSKTGYVLQGSTIRTRALFLLYFREMLPLYRDGVLDCFDRAQVESHVESLRKIERELGVTYVDGILHALAALLCIMLRTPASFDFSDENRAEWMHTREYALVRKHIPQLSQEESIYLTLHLLGSRLSINQDFIESSPYEEVMDLTRSLVSEFERIACVIFDDRQKIEHALCAHLKTSLYRYQYGIQIDSVFYDEVKRQYPELFAITKAAVKRLEKTIEVPIPDQEVACIALHFGAVLRTEEISPNKLRILIVCVNGVATGNMLRCEVHRMLPYAEIVDVVAAVDMVNAQNICNLIISTVKVNSIVPVITVHPVLTEFDRHAILNHRLVVPQTLTIQRDRIFSAVKRFVDPQRYDELKNELMHCLQADEMLLSTEAKADTGLLSVLDMSRVQVVNRPAAWRESIRISGKPLLDNGSISKRYLDTIISQLSYYGPYMFLTENVLLAHAKPKDGVNCLDISMTVFHPEVPFSLTRQAKIVFVLAAEDQERHLKILQDILFLVSNEEAMGQLVTMKNSSEILSSIGYYLSQAKE